MQGKKLNKGKEQQKLTKREEAFCQLYAGSFNRSKRECMRMAGYSESTISRDADLLKKPHIISRILELRFNRAPSFKKQFLVDCMEFACRILNGNLISYVNPMTMKVDFEAMAIDNYPVKSISLTRNGGFVKAHDPSKVYRMLIDAQNEFETEKAWEKHREALKEFAIEIANSKTHEEAHRKFLSRFLDFVRSPAEAKAFASTFQLIMNSIAVLQKSEFARHNVFTFAELDEGLGKLRQSFEEKYKNHGIEIVQEKYEDALVVLRELFSNNALN